MGQASMGLVLMDWPCVGRNLMGRALMALLGLMGQALMGWALRGPLGPNGPCSHGPPWALTGRALMAPPGALWAAS